MYVHCFFLICICVNNAARQAQALRKLTHRSRRAATAASAKVSDRYNLESARQTDRRTDRQTQCE